MNGKDKANEIIFRLCKAGWEAYIAGGAARDILNGEIPNDYDVVTNAPYNIIKKLFINCNLSIVNAGFKICIIDGIEVARYRKGAWFDPVFNNFRITKADTIQQDLAQRDLTINAMAFCPYNGEIIDENGGRNDLKNRIIKFTGNPVDRIKEDPCRILRACRFLAKLEGKFDLETLNELQNSSYLVKKYVAPERIRLEIIKSMQYSKPSMFFDALHDIGILKYISPGFEACYGHDGGHYHGETIDTHIKLVGDLLPAQKPLFRLAGYFHDHGKPAAAKQINNKLSFINHAKIGADLIEDELNKLRFSVKEIAYIKALIKHHMRDIKDKDKPKTVRRFLKTLAQDKIKWKEWLQLKIADTKANFNKKNLDQKQIKNIVLKIHNELHPAYRSAAFKISDLAINGNDIIKILNIKPCPKIGSILNHALDYVLDNPECNTYSELTRFIKNEKYL